MRLMRLSIRLSIVTPIMLLFRLIRSLMRMVILRRSLFPFELVKKRWLTRWRVLRIIRMLFCVRRLFLVFFRLCLRSMTRVIAYRRALIRSARLRCRLNLSVCRRVLVLNGVLLMILVMLLSLRRMARLFMRLLIRLVRRMMMVLLAFISRSSLSVLIRLFVIISV